MGYVIYIHGNPVKGISDLEINTDDITDEYIGDHMIYSLNDDLSLTATVKVNKIDLWKLFGIYSWVIDNCHNRRVVHLIKHGKNDKIRKKNFNRALKIIVKELN